MKYTDEPKYKRPSSPRFRAGKRKTPYQDTILRHVIQTARDMERVGMGHLSLSHIHSYTDRVWPELYVEGWLGGKQM